MNSFALLIKQPCLIMIRYDVVQLFTIFYGLHKNSETWEFMSRNCGAFFYPVYVVLP